MPMAKSDDGREKLSFGPGPLSEGHRREYQTQLVLMPDGDDTPLYAALKAALDDIIPSSATQYIISTQPGVDNIYITYRYSLMPGEDHPQSRPGLYTPGESGRRPDLEKMEKVSLDTSKIPASIKKFHSDAMAQSGFETETQDQPASKPKRKYGL